MDSDARRPFLKRLFGVLTAGLGFLIGGPIVAAFFDPARRRAPSPAIVPTDLGKVADLPTGRPIKLDVVSSKTDAWDRADTRVIGAVWLTRHRDGEVRALSAVCPHLGCSVGFDDRKQVYACPCHESAFALEDGARIMGPSPRGLDPLPVRIEGGSVFVTYKRFIQGIPTRREG